MRDLSKIVDQLGNLTVRESNTLAGMLRSRWEKPRKPNPILSRYEGEVCDAMVRRLEEREGHTRGALRWPEKENHQHPVELMFKLGNQLCALWRHHGVRRAAGCLLSGLPSESPMRWW
jgi:hypothetical protein